MSEGVYYQITLIERSSDEVGCLPWKCNVRVIRKLVYNGEDGNLAFDLDEENESLAVEILVQCQIEAEYSLIVSPTDVKGIV